MTAEQNTPSPQTVGQPSQRHLAKDYPSKQPTDQKTRFSFVVTTFQQIDGQKSNQSAFQKSLHPSRPIAESLLMDRRMLIRGYFEIICLESVIFPNTKPNEECRCQGDESAKREGPAWGQGIKRQSHQSTEGDTQGHTKSVVAEILSPPLRRSVVIDERFHRDDAQSGSHAA